MAINQVVDLPWFTLQFYYQVMVISLQAYRHVPVWLSVNLNSRLADICNCSRCPNLISIAKQFKKIVIIKPLSYKTVKSIHLKVLKPKIGLLDWHMKKAFNLIVSIDTNFVSSIKTEIQHTRLIPRIRRKPTLRKLTIQPIQSM